MGKGFFKVPVAKNEPILSYAPGTKERENVLSAYKSMYDSRCGMFLRYVDGRVEDSLFVSLQT